jgi:hypothetical protein
MRVSMPRIPGIPWIACWTVSRYGGVVAHLDQREDVGCPKRERIFTAADLVGRDALESVDFRRTRPDGHRLSWVRGGRSMPELFFGNFVYFVRAGGEGSGSTPSLMGAPWGQSSDEFGGAEGTSGTDVSAMTRAFSRSRR